MNPAQLAATAASALVGAMATDAWEEARAAVVSLWHRVYPGRAETVAEELLEVRQDVLAAQQTDVRIEESLIEEWQRRLQRMLEASPKMAIELQCILDDVFRPVLDREQRDSIVMNARASEHGRVFQAGRDMHITE